MVPLKGRSRAPNLVAEVPLGPISIPPLRSNPPHDEVGTTDVSINRAILHFRRAFDSPAGDVEEQILFVVFCILFSAPLRLRGRPCLSGASSRGPGCLSGNRRGLARRGAEARRRNSGSTGVQVLSTLAV